MAAALVAACLFAAAPHAASAQDAMKDGRVQTYLASADRLIDDLRYIVAELAGEQGAYDDAVFPNIEVWFYGVDLTKPVGTDIVFDPEAGRRVVFIAPIADREEFRTGNLGGIDITAKPVPGKRNLYKLSDQYEGWMRFVQNEGDSYVVVSEQLDDLPETLAYPGAAFEVFQQKAHDGALRWEASAAKAADRQQGFDKLKENVLENVKKRPEESTAEFELRRLIVLQQTDRLARLLTGCALFEAGWTTDPQAQRFGGETLMRGLPGSSVAETIGLVGSQASKFASLPASSEAVLSMRVMVPVNADYQREQAELYQKWLAAWLPEIDEKAEFSAEQKTARKQAAEQIVGALTQGLTTGWLDAALEVTPSANALYTAVVGVRIADAAAIPPILETFPGMQPGWTTELNVEQHEGLAIHKMVMQEKLASSLRNFHGASGVLYVGLGDGVMWAATGPDALERLKAAATAAAAPVTNVEPFAVKVSLKFHPVLTFLHSFVRDQDIDLMRSLMQSGFLPDRSKSTENADGDKEGPKKVSADVLKNFAWEETAIAGLAGGQDGIEFVVRRVDDALTSELAVQVGVIRAAGKVVAKFATEVLQ